MTRTVAMLAALAAALGGGVVARAADAPLTGGGVVAKLAVCDMTSSDRSATFVARMETIPGASRLALRFQLLQKLGRGQPWTRLDLPALRQWHTSQAGVKRYGWRQTVDNLRLGAAYKAHVQFRWLSATGVVLDSATRDTPACRGPMPNITIGDLTANPGPMPDTRVYRIPILNTGKTDADDVKVSLSVDQAVLDTVTIAHLAAGDVHTVSFTGPACHSGVRVEADPANSIGETIEEDNSQFFACP